MLIQFAVTITVLLAFCGLGIDVGLLTLKKIQLQTAADAAAVGASFQAGSAQLTAGRADAALNGFTDGASGTTVTVTSPPSSGAYAGNASAVQATVSQAVQPFFFPHTVMLRAQSTAMGASDCLYLFSKSFTNSPSFSQVGGDTYSDCPFYLGLGYDILTGTSTGAQYYIAAGVGIAIGSVTPAPIFNVPQVADPLASVSIPALGPCLSPPTPAHGLVTVNPGTYCGGLSFTGVDVTLNPGVYVITGNLSINNHHSITGPSLSGSGVTIYMTKDSTHGYGAISISNASSISLSAPTSGPYEGILIFTDRNMPPQQSPNQALNIINSISAVSLDGILYMLNQQIATVNFNVTCNNYLGIVADSLDLKNGSLTVKSDYSTLAHGNPFHNSPGLVE